MDKIVIKKSLYAAAGPAGLFATAVGFFSDFVKPYLNLVPYFFILCALCAAGLWIFVVRKQARHGNLDEILQTRSGMVFAISVLASVFWLIMLPIFALTPERGLAASAVPSIGDWQERLFGKLDRIESKIDTVLSKIEQIDSGSAGLIASPKTSNDHYHNARIHELNGNLVEAKKSYEAYFKSGLSYVDPFFSYALILKNLEGPSSARVLMGELRDSYPDNPAASLAYIMAKEDRTDRITLLTALTKSRPEFAPAYFYLAKQYAFSEAGLQTNDDRRKEREALQALQESQKTEGFSKYYVDKKTAEEGLEWVKSELKLMEGILGGMIDAPLKISVTTSNKSSTITFTPTELVKKFFYRIDKQGEFKDTGTSGIMMPGSSEPLPNYYVMVSLPLGKHTIEAKYIDSKGEESATIEYPFEIVSLTIPTAPNRLIDPNTGKVQYMVFWNTFEQREYVFRYSLNNQSLDQVAPEYLNGVILTDLAPGKYTLYAQGEAQGEKTNIAQVEFEVQ